MSKINEFIQSVITATSAPADGNLNTTNPTLRQLKSNTPLDNQEAIDALMTRLDDDKKLKPKPATNQTRYPAYELSLILPPGKKAIPYEALEINVIKDIFKQRGINISNGAAEAIAAKAPLDFTPEWDANRKQYVANEKDGLYYRDSSFGKNSDMVLAGKEKNIKGVEFNGYKYYISSELQASVLAERDFAVDVTKNGGKAFLEKTFNERFGMTLDKALADLPADIREKLKDIDAKTLLSAVMVGGAAIAALRKLPSEAVAVLAAGLTLKDVIQYGTEANHIADRIENAAKPGDLPVEELKSLITNGGLDILLVGAGYAGAKLAPKFAKLGDDTLKLTDDVARRFDDAYRATKGKVAELANKVDDALSPGMVTTEGIVIKPKPVKGSDVLEMRAKREAPFGRRDIESHETRKTESGSIIETKRGHTIEKHVDKSEGYLKERLAKENIEIASTFFNKKIGNQVQLTFLKKYKSEMAAWLKSSYTKPFVKEFEMPMVLGRVKGKGKASSLQATNKARVVVIKDNSAQGWRFETSFPIPK